MLKPSLVSGGPVSIRSNGHDDDVDLKIHAQGKGRVYIDGSPFPQIWANVSGISKDQKWNMSPISLDENNQEPQGISVYNGKFYVLDSGSHSIYISKNLNETQNRWSERNTIT